MRDNTESMILHFDSEESNSPYMRDSEMRIKRRKCLDFTVTVESKDLDALLPKLHREKKRKASDSPSY